MHILITADTVGGVWTYTHELVRGLLARKHRVTLVSFGALPKPEEESRLRGLERLGYFPSAYRLEWMPDSEKDIAESTKYLEQIIEDKRPDILHLNQYCYGAVKAKVPRLLVAHSDVFSWWNAVHGSDPPPSQWSTWYAKTVNKGLSGADMVVAPSQWMMDALVKHYRVPARRIVVYNGRSPSLFDYSKTKPNCALSVGRVWDSGKQTGLLLTCNAGVPLRIVGPTKAPVDVVDSVKSLALPPSVEVCGALDERELRSLYAESATYVATSRYEPFGLAPVEAALSRCALIANDLPVFHELWGDAAIYFRRDDAQALGMSLRRLYDDEALREEYGGRAYQRARECFDAARMVDEYVELYQQLTAEGTSA